MVFRPIKKERGGLRTARSTHPGQRVTTQCSFTMVTPRFSFACSTPRTVMPFHPSGLCAGPPGAVMLPEPLLGAHRLLGALEYVQGFRDQLLVVVAGIVSSRAGL